MRLIPSCPGFRHAVVSVAALHQANRVASGLCNEKDMAWTIDSNKHQTSQPVEQLQQLPASYDALYYKQRTLGFLKAEAYEGRFSYPDGVIASMILPIWFELMDSGRDAWKYHLHGLRETMQQRDFSLALLRDGGIVAALPRMNEYFDTSYAM